MGRGRQAQRAISAGAPETGVRREECPAGTPPGARGEEPLRDMQLVERIVRNIGAEDRFALLATESLVNLFRTHTLLYELWSALLAPYDLSPAKYNLLAVLYSEPERRLRMCDISARMSVTRTNITKLVDGLERDGLVQRTSLPDDRRVVLTELTPKGEALVKRMKPLQCANMQTLCSGLSEADCLQLTHLMLKLRQSALAAAPAGGAGLPEAESRGREAAMPNKDEERFRPC
ncbi:MAG TPA: MarR family transcriptional regulator [Chthonomonadaceae bacterium]|nr:MarR family transcriptional regulator [Chthonomonadaceae bacterium]